MTNLLPFIFACAFLGICCRLPPVFLLAIRLFAQQTLGIASQTLSVARPVDSIEKSH